MLSIEEVIVVEGRYDKNTVLQAVDATVVETAGFGVFTDREKLDLLRRMAKARGLVILTDSDGAGFMIRNFLKGTLGVEVKQAYIPEIPGRERRKRTASKAGSLGVEGMTREVIVNALRKSGATFSDGARAEKKAALTKADLYELGLAGRPFSAERRRTFLARAGLPAGLSSNAFLDVINVLYTKEELLMLIS